jgi:hypothetical protein
MTPEEFERICFQSHGQDLAALNYAQDRIIALAKDRDEWKATAMNMNDEKKSLMSKLHQLGLVAEGERANRIMVERRLDEWQKWYARIADHIGHKWGCATMEEIPYPCDCGGEQLPKPPIVVERREPLVGGDPRDQMHVDNKFPDPLGRD